MRQYITGERFDAAKNAFKVLESDDPDCEEFRRRFKTRTEYDSWTTALPHSELDIEGRFGQSLSAAGRRFCQDYHPKTLPETPTETKDYDK